MEHRRIKTILGLIGLVVCAGCDQRKPEDPAKASTSLPASPGGSALSKPALSSSLGSSTPNKPSADPASPPTPSAPSPEETAKLVAALQEIDSSLRDKQLPPAEAGLKMAKLAADPNVPLAARTDALQHAMNLLSDQGFASLDGMLKDQKTPVPLLDMVFVEVHNRPATTQLPVALSLLHSANPEVASRARNLLAFHLNRDYGDDFSAWDRPVAEELAKLGQSTNQ